MPVTIVGVGPAGHNATIDIGIVTDFWMPITSAVALGAPPRTLERRPEEAGFLVKARLRDGVTVAQARAAMRILGARLAAEYPSEDPGKGIMVFAATNVRVHPQLDGVLRWIATVNPMSVMVSAIRELFGNPVAPVANPSWPLEHAVFTAFVYCGVLLAIAVPMCLRRYRARTVDS